MPTYQYTCTACGHQLEAVQAFTDDSLTECPECAGRLRKVFGSVGVVFKGSGFYRTDSRAAAGDNGAKESTKEPAGKEPAATGSGSASGGTSGDGKGEGGKSDGGKPSETSKPAGTTAKPADKAPAPATT